MPHLPGIGAIAGIVSEGGVAKTGGRVGLYDRSTMQLVKQTVADSLGGYLFTGLNQTSSDYLVMALDDDGSPAKNALVQDYITPFPAHMGATFPGNWYRLAMQLDPYVIWVPQFSSNNIAQPTAPSVGAITVTGNFLANQTSLTAGAPQIPAITLQSAYLQIGPRGRVGGYIVASPINWSLEWVLNTANSGGLWIPTGGTSLRQGIAMNWDRSGHNLRWGFGKDISSSFPYDTGYTWTTYNNNSIADGAHHFVLTVVGGSQAKLYLDGTLVQTTSLSGGNATIASPTTQVIAAQIGGNSTTSQSAIAATAGNFTSGPFAMYPVVLTSTQITDLYNALMVGSSPVVSAYARDVMTDAPGVYIRTEAATAVTETEWLSRGAIGYYGTVTVQNASPVTGGYMAYFNGGVLYGKGYGGQIDQYQNTIEFWFNPDSATPAASGCIICGRQYDESTVNFEIDHLITTGKIGLTIRLAGPSNETVTFNYQPPATTNTLIAITIDKVALAAKIYANGVLQDTQTLSVGLCYTATNLVSDGGTNDGNQITSRYLMIGGKRTQAGANSVPFHGYLSEIAIYTHLVGVDRLLSHYTSRTLT